MIQKVNDQPGLDLLDSNFQTELESENVLKGSSHDQISNDEIILVPTIDSDLDVIKEDNKLSGLDNLSIHEPKQPKGDGENHNHTLPSKIDKEEKLFEIHNARVTAKWKKILRQEKFDSLHDEGTYMKEHYQQEIQRKDDLIQTLIDSCDQSEGQTRSAFASYMQNLDVILQTFDCQLEAADHDFRTTFQQLSEAFRNDCEFIQTNANNHIRDYEEKIKSVELCEQANVAQETQRCQNIIQEINSNGAQDVQCLRSNLDANIEDLEDKLTSTYTEFLHKTDCTAEELKILVSQGESLSVELREMKDTIHGLKRSIHNLQTHSERDSNKCFEVTSNVLDRRNLATERYYATKNELSSSRKNHGRKLKHLALQAHNYKTEISKRLVILERIMKQSQLFFPLQENTCPRKAKRQHKQVISLVELVDYTTMPVTTSSIEQMFSNLDGFWQEYNAVKHQLHDLKLEEHALLRRRESLQV